MKALTIVLVVGSCAMSVAYTKDIYQCKDEHGAVVFTDHACTDGKTGKTTLREADVPKSPDQTPSAVTQEPPFAPARPVGQPMSREITMSPALQEQPSSSGVHQCSDGDKMWIQSSPCPASVKKQSVLSAPFSGTDQYGNQISGSANFVQTTRQPVQQTDLTHDQACQKIYEQKNKGSASDTYERNKMRQNEGC